MKIVLVRPPSFTMPIIIPNLGLGYLASILREKKYLVKILDCAKERMNHQKFKKYLEKEKPDVLGIQLFTCDFSSTKKCFNIAKQLDPKILTLVGGPHPSGDPIGIMNSFKNLDFAFSGEAELGLPKLLEYIEAPKNTELKSVQGLVYRNNKEVIVNKQGRIKELDKLPFPSWDLLDPRTYPTAAHGSFTKSLPVAPIITTRGCPFNCSFCAAKIMSGKNFRIRSIDSVIKEIKYLQRNFGVKEIHIEDDNFTLVKSRVLKFCKKLKQENINIDWACPNGVRLDTLDEELLKNMEKTGCYSFAVGIESGSPRILSDMKKGEILETIRKKIKLIASVSKIRMTGFFILGYPTETKDDIMKTISFSLSLPLHRAQFSNFIPLPGTEIYDNLIRSGEIKYKLINWDSYQDNSIAYSPKGISKKELKKNIRKAFAKFYFRPLIIIGLLKEIHSFNQLKIVILRVFDIFR